MQNENRRAFIIAVFDLVNAREPVEITTAARSLWAKLFNDPDVVPPLDYQILDQFVGMPEKRIIAFSNDMRRALDTYIFPALKGEILINVDLPHNLTNKGFKRSDLYLFDTVKIDCMGFGGTKKPPVAHIPMLAVEAYLKLTYLPDGIKVCAYCNNLFFHTRKNIRFCENRCKVRYHTEKAQKRR